MTSEANASDELDGTGDSEPEPNEHPDWVLKALLDSMESGPYSIGITLVVQGAIVSGTPIFMSEYFERMGNTIGRASSRSKARHRTEVAAENTRPLGEVLQAEFAHMADQFKLPEVVEGDEDSISRRQEAINEITVNRRDHIMLKDVLILSPDGGRINMELWRGRFETVGGWSLGTPD